MKLFVFVLALVISNVKCQDENVAKETNWPEFPSTFLDRFNEMERKMDVMQNKIEMLEEENTDLKARVNVLEKNHPVNANGAVNDNKGAADDVTGAVPVKTAFSGLGTWNKQKQAEDSSVPLNQQQHTTLNQRQSRLVLGEDGPVAFCAVLKASTTQPNLGVKQPIIYDTLVTNIGGGFHMPHGLFTAPRSGLYLLSASVLSYTGFAVRASIVVNGVQIVNIYANVPNDFDQGTQVIVVQLTQGDDVAVEIVQNGGVAIWGDMYTSFSGYLLTPM